MAKEAVQAQVCEEAEGNDAIGASSIASHSCYKDDDIESSEEMFQTSSNAGGFQPISFDGIVPPDRHYRTTVGSLVPTLQQTTTVFLSP